LKNSYGTVITDGVKRGEKKNLHLLLIKEEVLRVEEKGLGVPSPGMVNNFLFPIASRSATVSIQNPFR
jgi:hypothetical protein